jgi:hypothetical protein
MAIWSGIQSAVIGNAVAGIQFDASNTFGCSEIEQRVEAQVRERVGYETFSRPVATR